MAAFPSEVPMKNLLVLLLFASSLFLRAQSRFEGTWEMKMDTLQFAGPPEDYLFADGMYHCKSCIPKVDVKTDGVDHEVAGYSYDTLAVRILDDHAIKFPMKKAGKPCFECIETVSPAGQKMPEDLTNMVAAETVTGKAGLKEVC